MARRDPLEPGTAGATRGPRPPPFPFVLDELEPLHPRINPMFGSHGVYIGDKIVFILRDKGPDDRDKGIWVVFEKDQEAAVRAALPSLRDIEVLGEKITNWKKLSPRDSDFEESALRACELVLRRDPCIGKVPESKKPKVARKAAAKPGAVKARAAKPTASTKASKTRAKSRSR